mmetsp:Transcript_31830/g.101813  ORF Transcript_31830/g.101813 Transcript_31830/m.101813 type:complete len:274 (-) Transcript_31830:237-1058(-)
MYSEKVLPRVPTKKSAPTHAHRSSSATATASSPSRALSAVSARRGSEESAASSAASVASVERSQEASWRSSSSAPICDATLPMAGQKRASPVSSASRCRSVRRTCAARHGRRAAARQPSAFARIRGLGRSACSSSARSPASSSEGSAAAQNAWSRARTLCAASPNAAATSRVPRRGCGSSSDRSSSTPPPLPAAMPRRSPTAASTSRRYSRLASSERSSGKSSQPRASAQAGLKQRWSLTRATPSPSPLPARAAANWSRVAQRTMRESGERSK